MPTSRFAQLPDPPYYAVIFTSRRTAADPDGYDRTADQQSNLKSEHGDNRNQGVFECVSKRDGAARQAFRARGRDVLLSEHLEHRRTYLAHQHRSAAAADRDRWQQHQFQICQWILQRRYVTGRW